ncbi:hypothetical protein AB0362_13170 [Rhodococcus sp. NPDC079359]|uniref:hypothetical protein n=1 Tax=Rhodococcus sp. NPDC079359 TaxID=3154961 RepID=UPI00344DB73A
MTQTLKDFSDDPNWERLRARTSDAITRRIEAGGNIQGPPETPDIEFLTPDVKLLDEQLRELREDLKDADPEEVPTYAKAFGVE